MTRFPKFCAAGIRLGRSSLMMVFILGFISCRAVEERMLVSLLDYYVAAQEALAEDNYGEAKTSLQALANEGEGELQVLAEKAAACTDIKAMREEFQFLSKSLVKMKLPQGYVLASCRHGDEEGLSWVQKDAEIMNPYHGSSNLRCGSIEKKAEMPAR
ncbi:MAG: hypothetical protein ACE5MK_06990 [Acidobacteriota bacterium]